MDSKWAAENLQTIRTLMERTAVYRRALAPTMLVSGGVGIATALLGWLRGGDHPGGFVLLWLGAAIIALAGAMLVIRKQALGAAEPFWTAPTRRIGQAVLPAFLAGAAVAVAGVLRPDRIDLACLVGAWTVFYGLGLHAAAFFMQRGVRLFSWGLILWGIGLILARCGGGLHELDGKTACLWMGGIFGASHLGYGIYLRLTERSPSP